MNARDVKIDFDHRQSAHCESGVTSNLLRFQGIDLDEPMVFGIGSGLFFSYMPFIRVNGLPVVSFRPWPGTIFNRVNKRLGITIKRARFRDAGEAMKALDRNLDRGIPTGCLVGVYHLTYFPPAYRFHFNAHNLVAIGRENGEYLVSDPIMEGVEKLSYNDMQKVRFSRGTYPPKGRMYFIEGVSSGQDIPSAIVKGIRQTCQDMLRIPVPLFGVKGIRYLARRMRNWPRKYGDKKAALHMGQVVRMLEEIGTGGAGFRFMYAAFLQEAARILGMEELNAASEQMTAAGDRWREFAIIAGRIFKNRAGQDENYRVAASILMDIADLEERIFRELDRIKFKKA